MTTPGWLSFEDVISIFTTEIQNTQGCSYNSPTSDILHKISKDNKDKYEEEFAKIMNEGKVALRENADEVCNKATELLANSMTHSLFVPDENDESSEDDL